VPVRPQGHVEQHEQANRDGVEDEASHAGLIGLGRLVVEGRVGLLEAGNALAPITWPSLSVERNTTVPLGGSSMNTRSLNASRPGPRSWESWWNTLGSTPVANVTRTVSARSVTSATTVCVVGPDRARPHRRWQTASHQSPYCPVIRGLFGAAPGTGRLCARPGQVRSNRCLSGTEPSCEGPERS
jgi:hypothetical protein